MPQPITGPDALREFARTRLPVRGCSTHGLACYGAAESISSFGLLLRRPDVHDAVADDLRWLVALPNARSVTALALGVGVVFAFHPRPLTNLQIGALLTRWSAHLDDIDARGAAGWFLEVAGRSALFPPVALADDVAARWRTALRETLERPEWERLLHSIPTTHFASGETYLELGDDDARLGLLLERPPAEVAVRGAVFERLRERLLEEPRLRLLALEHGWVPPSWRARWTRRCALAHEGRACRLVALLVEGDAEAATVAREAAEEAATALSAKEAASLIAAADRLPDCGRVLLDGVVEGLSRSVDEAARLGREPPGLRARVAARVAERALASRDGVAALAALRRLDLRPSARAELASLALRQLGPTDSMEAWISLLAVPEIASDPTNGIASRCLRATATGAGALRPLVTALASWPRALESARAVCAELASASDLATFIMDVIEFVPPDDTAVLHQLVRRAARLLSVNENRPGLERLLALSASEPSVYGEVLAEALRWHTSHPAAARERSRQRQRLRSAEREQVLASLAGASAAERLRAILASGHDMHYWPVDWAQVQESEVSALLAEERAELAQRLQRGPRAWRVLGRRLARIGAEPSRDGGGGLIPR